MTNGKSKSWAVWLLLLGGLYPYWEAAAADSFSGSVDEQTSRVFVFVGKVGLGHEHAIAGAIKAGVVHLGAAENAGELVFDMASFAADTAEARKYLGLAGATSAGTQKEVNANMLGTAVLDVRRYPTATFQRFNPVMTVDRYLLAGIWTIYIFAGSYLKHKRLAHFLGDAYRRYQQQVSGYPGMQFGPLARLPQSSKATSIVSPGPNAKATHGAEAA